MSLLVVKNGHIYDPGANRDEYGAIMAENGKIIPYDESKITDDTEIIDAKGYYVFPGLIDFHTHVAYGMGEVGANADLVTIPNGVTSAVDQGTTGSVSFEGFVNYVIPHYETRVKGFCHVSPLGIATDLHTETTDPRHYDEERLRMLAEKYYPHTMLGLKIRLGKLFTSGQGVEPLVAAKKIARNIGVPVCVHLNNSEVDYEDVLPLLDPGDILCHCYQGMGKTILGDSGKIVEAAWEARKRGVYFDAAVGRINHDFAVMQQALSEGFLPDLITTDSIKEAVYRYKLFNLPYTLSYFLDLGFPLADIITAVTKTAAKLMHMEGKIGTLEPGAYADIAIFDIAERAMVHRDCFGHEIEGKHLFLPQATIKDGRPVYKRIEFEYWD